MSLQTLKNILLQKLTAAPFLVRAITALFAGSISVLAMPPWHLYPLLFVGMSLFYILLTVARTGKEFFFYGWFFAFGYHLFGLSWIGNALLVEGNGYAWAWPLAVAGLPFLLAFFSAAAMWPLRFTNSLSHLSGFFYFITLTSLAEAARGHLFTGFPWNLYGYTWDALLPVAQVAALSGIDGLTLLTVFWIALPGFLLAGKTSQTGKTLLLMAAIASFVFSYSYGAARLAEPTIPPREEINIRLVQPNIAQKDKWAPDKAGENLDTLIRLSLPDKMENELNTTIIIWPETAISHYLMENESARTALRQMLGAYKNKVYLLTGILRQERDTEQRTSHYYNSMILYDSDLNPLATYNKDHLVPFGEYIPFQKFIPLKPVAAFTGFSRNTKEKIIDIPGIPPIIPLICYEVIFPNSFTRVTEKTAAWSVNATNDGWYGDSAGPYQHLSQARFRTIETGTPLVRSANTGISAVIDSKGRFIARLPLLEAQSQNVSLPGKEYRKTFFMKFSRYIPYIMLLLTLIAGLFFHFFNKKTKKHTKKVI